MRAKIASQRGQRDPETRKCVVPGGVARFAGRQTSDFGLAPTIHPFAPTTDHRLMSARLCCGDVNPPEISPHSRKGLGNTESCPECGADPFPAAELTVSSL